MPQLYYDDEKNVRAPVLDDYDHSSLDYQYNHYMDTLYYIGHCKNSHLPLPTDIQRVVHNLKNALLLRFVELELSVGYSAVDYLVGTFNSNQVTGWMKEFEIKSTPEGDLFYYKQ